MAFTGTRTVQMQQCGICSLPCELLKHILSLLPDQEAHLSLGSAGEFGFIATLTKGPAEQVCRLWRRLALELPISRITLDFGRGVRSTELPGFVPAVIQALGDRPVLEVEVANAGHAQPLELWRALGSGLVAGARKLSLSHDIHSTNELPPKTLELLAHCASLEELYMDVDCLPDDNDGAVANLVGQAVRQMPRLRQLDLFGVLLTEGLGQTIVDLPHIADVRLQLAFNTPFEDAWRLLAQLGGRLTCLGLFLDWSLLEWVGGAPPVEGAEPEGVSLPAGLLALTELGGFDLQLFEFGGARLEGLERVPLHRLIADGGCPPNVWRCTQLTELSFMGEASSLPPAGLTLLPPLRSLALVGHGHAPGGSGFPAVLCGLSLLTSLRIDMSDFRSCKTLLPPEASRLSALQQLAVHDTKVADRQVAESMAHLGRLASLTSLELSMCGLTDLPAGPYLHALRELAIHCNAFQPRRAPIPPAVTAAAQLTSLKVSLDAEPAGLQSQWPQVQSVLAQLTKLKVMGVSFLKGGAAPQPNAFGSVPALNPEAFGRLLQLKEASGLAGFLMQDIGR